MPHYTYGRMLEAVTPTSLRKKCLSLGGRGRIELECAVEQRLARQAHNLEVVGSIPTGATSISACHEAIIPELRGFFMRSIERQRRHRSRTTHSVARLRLSDRCDRHRTVLS